mmetsp:Transcript_10315/g.24708  ORF Transcript_10315/g.24708 Transcript_10315/m.24708 type:complete len:406 (+) Transcript_10315:418-1635(+)
MAKKAAEKMNARNTPPLPACEMTSVYLHTFCSVRVTNASTRNSPPAHDGVAVPDTSTYAVVLPNSISMSGMRAAPSAPSPIVFSTRTTRPALRHMNASAFFTLSCAMRPSRTLVHAAMWCVYMCTPWSLVPQPTLPLAAQCRWSLPSRSSLSARYLPCMYSLNCELVGWSVRRMCGGGIDMATRAVLPASSVTCDPMCRPSAVLRWSAACDARCTARLRMASSARSQYLSNSAAWSLPSKPLNDGSKCSRVNSTSLSPSATRLATSRCSAASASRIRQPKRTSRIHSPRGPTCHGRDGSTCRCASAPSLPPSSSSDRWSGLHTASASPGRSTSSGSTVEWPSCTVSATRSHARHATSAQARRPTSSSSALSNTRPMATRLAMRAAGARSSKRGQPMPPCATGICT